MRIKQSYTIKASPERVWAALTDAKQIKKWSGQPAKFQTSAGGKYQMFGDYVSGKIVTFEPPTRLAQTWKPVDWTITDSVVTFTLKPSRGGTRIDLLHENVEPADYDGTSRGWDEFYLGPIRAMLEAESL